MAFNLTPNISSSSLVVSVNDTVIKTAVTSLFLAVRDKVDEYLLTYHSDEAALELIILEFPWPPIQVQLSKTYEPY